MMDSMKSPFGKYWVLYLAGVTVLSIVVFSVLVYIHRATDSPAQWLFSYIIKWTAASAAFRFIVDWAESLSAAAAITIIIAAFLEFRDIRRQRASARVKKWARDAVAELNCPVGEKSVDSRMADWKSRIIPIRIESSNALANARVCGNGLELKVDKALKTLTEFEYYLDKRKEFADIKTPLQTTVGAFTEVMN
jgi:hypothetical protein